MNNNINKSKRMHIAGGMIFSFLTASMLFTFSSCADDHFNIGQDVTGTKTIWENIKENQEVSDYAYILEHLPYSLKEKGFTSETYAEVLNGDQTFTIWAPKNGSYNFEYYKKLIESGIEDSIKKVENEFVRNNMTRYTHIMNGQEAQKLILLNGKRATLDFANNTFRGQSIIRPNIGSSNGVLHITQSPASFIPNIYEYIQTRTDATMLNKFLKKYEVEEFDEYSSSAGPTVNGTATWVDSVTFRYNTYLTSVVEREDSNYVAIVPTDKAWNSVYDKIAKFYNYKKYYSQFDYVADEDKKVNYVAGKETVIDTTQMDSIKELRIANGLLKGMIFNANWQPRQVPITSLNDIAKVDSLETYKGYKFKKAGTLNENDDKSEVFEVDNFVDMFGGNEPIECSNGYAYITDSWNYPSSLYAPTFEYNPAYVFDNVLVGKTTVETGRHTLTHKDENGNTVVDSVFNYFQINGNKTNYTARFKLRNMLSGKYDIYIVTLDNFKEKLPTMFKADIIIDKKDVSTMATAKPAARYKPTTESLTNPFVTGVGSYGEAVTGKKQTTNFYTHQADSVHGYTDTICIAKDYEIPYCFYGLSDAYPILTITGALLSNDSKPDKTEYVYTYNLNLVSIILKPKTEE